MISRKPHHHGIIDTTDVNGGYNIIKGLKLSKCTKYLLELWCYNDYSSSNSFATVLTLKGKLLLAICKISYKKLC